MFAFRYPTIVAGIAGAAFVEEIIRHFNPIEQI
jgi:hypothetical protein